MAKKQLRKLMFELDDAQSQHINELYKRIDALEKEEVKKMVEMLEQKYLKGPEPIKTKDRE